VEYEERIAELEKLEHPKPLRELVYETFNAFAHEHPWVKGDDVKPKSIAREMTERFMDFNEYVREYELGRAEGTLLRYLSDAYKALVQTVPAPAKTPEIEEIQVFLRTMVRAVDSSLLDEWERMLSAEPDAAALQAAAAESPQAPTEPDVTRDERGFTVLVRNAMFQCIKALARQDWHAAAAMFGAEGDWNAARFEEALKPFFEEHSALRTDPTARAPQNTRITKTGRGTWEVVQVLSDPDGDDDWALAATVDLEASSKAGRPALVMRGVSR
jgi:hypothetical protein